MSLIGNIIDKVLHPSKAAGQAAKAQPEKTEVEISKILEERSKKAGQPLNWQTSIVDLMKLLDLDSSLDARKQLAKELNYTGDMNDTAEMNMWLHKQVMRKLAESGGKVPEELLH